MKFIIFLISFLYFATWFVNYYSKFYHILKYLNAEQRLSYFKNDFVITILSKNNTIKQFIIHNILKPFIKISYMSIFLGISLIHYLSQNDTIINEKINEIQLNKIEESKQEIIENEHVKIENEQVKIENEQENIENEQLKIENEQIKNEIDNEKIINMYNLINNLDDETTKIMPIFNKANYNRIDELTGLNGLNEELVDENEIDFGAEIEQFLVAEKQENTIISKNEIDNSTIKVIKLTKVKK